MNKIRILLANDHPLMRHGLKYVIEKFKLGDEIIEAENGRQVMTLAIQNRINLFILDYKLPEIGGIDTAKELLYRNPRAKIVIFTRYHDDNIISSLLNIGVLGFLSRNTDADEVQLAVNKVLAGEVYVRNSKEIAYIQDNQSGNILTRIKFTRRENELVTLLIKGKTSREISVCLGVTKKTVEIYRSRLLSKVNVRNTPELIDYVHCHGYF